jgi:hypothetical protein
MIQQVTITTESAESIKPLLESAIRGELKTLMFGIQRTRERLATFEKQFGMTSEEFARRFNGIDLKETLDFIEWSGEIETLRLLEERRDALQNTGIR